MSRARMRRQAIDALLRAVNINPALPMSWRMLEGIYRLSGDAGNAATAAAHVATLSNLPPEVVTATSLFSDGDLAPAEEIIRAFLLRHGNHPEAMRLLAKIGMARDVLDDAELLLEAVLMLAPDHRAARLDYAQVLVQRHKYRQAARAGRNSCWQLDPGESRTICSLAANRRGRAWASMNVRSRFIAAMLADMPDNPDVHLWLGHALKTIGQVGRKRSRPIARRHRRGPISGMPIGAWPISRPTVSMTTRLPQMRAAEAAGTTVAEDRCPPLLCAGQGAGGPRRNSRILDLL